MCHLTGDDSGAILVRGAGGALIVKVTGVAMGFGTQIVLARLLGTDNYGTYIYALTWINILALFCKLGLDTAALRFVPVYQAQEEWGLLRGFVRRSQQTLLGVSVVAASVFAAVLWLFRECVHEDVLTVFWVALLMLPAIVILRMLGACLQGMKRVVLAQIPQQTIHPMLLVGGIVLSVAVMRTVVEASVAMAMNLTATIGAIFIANLFFQGSLPKSYHVVQPTYQTRIWGKVAFSLLLISGFNLIQSQTDIVMIGFYLGTTDAGIYAAATRITTLISFGLLAVNSILAPMISHLYAQGRNEELQRLVTLAARGVLACALPVTVLITLEGKQILAFFGQAFSGAYTPLLILAVGQLVNVFSGSVGYMMTMTGYQMTAVYVFGLSTVLNILLNIILIPIFGMNGASLSTTLITSFWNIALLVFVCKHIAINPTVFSFLDYKK